MVFAQIGSVDPNHLKDGTILLLVGLGVLTSLAGVVVSIVFGTLNRRAYRQVSISDPKIHQISVSDMPSDPDLRYALKQVVDSEHSALRSQIASINANQDEVWKVMRAEDAETRRTMTEKFDAIQRSLGRIEGRLQSHPTHCEE